MIPQACAVKRNLERYFISMLPLLFCQLKDAMTSKNLQFTHFFCIFGRKQIYFPFRVAKQRVVHPICAPSTATYDRDALHVTARR